MEKCRQFFFKLKHLGPVGPILIAAAVITVFLNYTFFSNILVVYSDQKAFVASVFLVYFSLLVFILNLICVGPMAKPALIFILLFASLQAYVTDSFGSISDEVMIRNILKTDTAEVLELLNFNMGMYFLFFGVLPSILIFFLNTRSKSWIAAVRNRFLLGLVSLIAILGLLFSFSKSYASFFREQKPLRFSANPIYFTYSGLKVAAQQFKSTNLPLVTAGRDARIPESDTKRELIIFVLGETARADHFSLNGYERETNPLLKKEEVFSFKDVYSCGTSTATSVPCMFSIFGRTDFDHEKADHTENLADVLLHTGRVNVLWRDNNSDSKGVAVRVPYEDFKTAKNNTVCDEECRDEGMLVGLQQYIDSKSSGDIFIVLHQMGNHGPAYFKRYPSDFEIFKPVCKNIDLGQCTIEEIKNAYDNAILYTDYFLSKVIHLLKSNSSDFETAMLYVSDHGESLGENGLYLHGLPYSIAPIEQRKVPLIMWFGGDFLNDIDFVALNSRLGNTYSHDNIFHTVLQMMEVQTQLYDKSKDLIVYKEHHSK